MASKCKRRLFEHLGSQFAYAVVFVHGILSNGEDAWGRVFGPGSGNGATQLAVDVRSLHTAGAR